MAANTMFACMSRYRCHESEYATLVTVCVVANITVCHNHITATRVHVHLMEICSTH